MYWFILLPILCNFNCILLYFKWLVYIQRIWQGCAKKIINLIHYQILCSIIISEISTIDEERNLYKQKDLKYSLSIGCR